MTDPAALTALEVRLREEVQCVRDDFQVRLAAEDERCLEAERAAQKLAGQLQQLMQSMPAGPQGPESSDALAEHRCSPHLEPESNYTAIPADEPEGESSEAKLLDGSGNFRSISHMGLSMHGGLEFELKDLPCDMWGVAIMTLTRDLSEILGGGDNFGPRLTRFLYAMFCVALNLVLQLAILIWVNLYVVGASVWIIQGDYAQYRHDMYDSKGNFQLDKWKTWDGPRDSLCGAVLTKAFFLSVILFLWIGRMLGELKACNRLCKDIAAVPGAAAGADVTHTVLHRNGQHEVIALTCIARVSLYTLVVIPKLCIAFTLTFIGCRWLTATMSFGDLILNALALEFIINIDENILEFFLPQRTTANVEATKLAYPAKAPPTEAQEMSNMQWDYFRNIFFFLLTVGFTWVYLNYIQMVLPFYEFDVGEHCGHWFEERFVPGCKAFEHGCFPFGQSTAEPHDYDGESSYGER